MTEAKTKRTLWYTRRDGVVRGPYPEKQVSRYILLGRIRESDELRPDEGDWNRVVDCPDLIPDVMKLPPTEENRQRLLMARMREDERRPGDRRHGVAPAAQERRGRTERRRDEAPQLLRHRELKYEVSHVRPVHANLYRYPFTFAALILLGFLLGFVLRQEQADTLPPPDCAAQPRPGVNWNNCNLSGLRSEHADLLGARVRNANLDAAQLARARLAGADLEYSSLNLTDLRHADLSHANLRGVVLRGSDLRDAKLVEANLSYANLSGARLEGADLSGAILDHSIWIDQQFCAAGSVGECKREAAGLADTAN